jgi:hypothetical protein
MVNAVTDSILSLFFFQLTITHLSLKKKSSIGAFELHNVHTTFSFTSLINGYSLLIQSLIPHLRFAITVWMKTDTFSQAFTAQHNGRQRLQRMIQTELPLWKQIKMLRL